MESPDNTMDDFLKDLDTINEFCDQMSLIESTYGDDYYKSACNDCPLNDYCIAIPTRSSFEDLIRHVKRCVDIVKEFKGGEA